MDLRSLLKFCLNGAAVLALGGCAGLGGDSTSLDNLVDDRPPRPFPTVMREDQNSVARSNTFKSRKPSPQVVAKPVEAPPAREVEQSSGIEPLALNHTPTLDELASGRPRADQMRNLPTERVAIRSSFQQPVDGDQPSASSPDGKDDASPAEANVTVYESAEAAFAAQQILARLANNNPAMTNRQAGMDYSTVLQAQMQQVLQHMQQEDLLPPATQAQSPIAAAVATQLQPPVATAVVSTVSEPAVAPMTHTEPLQNSTNVTPEIAKPAATVVELLQQAEVARAQWIDTLEQTLASGDTKFTPSQKQRLQQELRLAYLAAGRIDEATEPIPDVAEADAESYKHLVFAMHHLLPEEADRRSPHRHALALRSLRDAEKELSIVSRLDLKNLTFCDSVQQFGWFNEFKRREFAAGQQVILYLEVENATAQKKSPVEYETELQGSYQIFNAANELVGERTLPLDKEVCRNWRRDYFLAYRIYLPDDLPAGSYRLELRLEDLKARPPAGGKKLGEGMIDFTVR